MKSLFALALTLLCLLFVCCQSDNTTENTIKQASPFAKNVEQLDHLILVINDLEKGVKDFEALTGVNLFLVVSIQVLFLKMQLFL